MIGCDKVQAAINEAEALDATALEVQAHRYEPTGAGLRESAWSARFASWLEAQNSLHLDGCSDCATYRRVTSAPAGW